MRDEQGKDEARSTTIVSLEKVNIHNMNTRKHNYVHCRQHRHITTTSKIRIRERYHHTSAVVHEMRDVLGTPHCAVFNNVCRHLFAKNI